MSQLNSFIRVAKDSDGKFMGTFQKSIGGNPLEIEGVALVDPNGNYIGGQLTPGFTLATMSGNVAAGTVFVSIIPSQDFDGTILGQSADASFIFQLGPVYLYTIGQIDYTITSGSLKILTLTPA